tara:strand:- start:431 stop:658 length:228 start_codon:yes stop_codon:yes gene_type:complete
MNHKSIIHDPHAEKMGKGKVGIVGESHIWDGPLSQAGRLHGEGSSSGITGMHLKLDAVPYGGMEPVTKRCCTHKS